MGPWRPEEADCSTEYEASMAQLTAREHTRRFFDAVECWEDLQSIPFWALERNDPATLSPEPEGGWFHLSDEVLKHRR